LQCRICYRRPCRQGAPRRRIGMRECAAFCSTSRFGS
jgi:hypothetical protein